MGSVCLSITFLVNFSTGFTHPPIKWAIMDGFWILRCLKKRFDFLILNTILKLAIFGNIWKYLAIFGNIWQYVAICGNIWQYLAIFGNIWKYLANIAKYFQILPNI